MTDRRTDMMPLWTDALLGDTIHLSTEAFGAYMKLLIVSWRSKTGDIPACDTFCKNTLGWSPRKWASIKPQVESFFEAQSGRWIQKRLKAEWEKAQARAERTVQSKHAKGSQKKQGKSPKKANDSIGARDRALAGAGAGADSTTPQDNSYTDNSLSQSVGESERETPIGFDEFWRIYPCQVRTDRQLAERAWLKLDGQRRDAALDEARTLAAAGKPQSLYPHTFLNGVEARDPPPSTSIIPFRTPEQEAARLAELEAAFEAQQSEERTA